MSKAVEALKKLPTATVHQSRLQFFEATRRPVWKERNIVTPWGDANIIGRCGQIHADAIEASFRFAEDFRSTDTGQVQILIDPHVLREATASNEKGRNTEAQVWKLLQETRAVAIDLNAKLLGFRVIHGVLDGVEVSSYTRMARNGVERNFWKLTVNAVWAAMMAEDLPLSYDPRPLARLSGISSAMVRLVITHRDMPNGGWKIDELIRAVGCGKTQSDIWNKRRDVKSDAGKLLDDFKLKVEEGRLLRID